MKTYESQTGRENQISEHVIDEKSSPAIQCKGYPAKTKFSTSAAAEMPDSRLANPTGPMIQAKLEINQPGDRYEQEADAVADRVLRMSQTDTNRQPIRVASATSVQRNCAHCEEKEKRQLRRKEIESWVPASETATENYVRNLSGGQPLTDETKSFFGSRMGYDFSSVRVHNDAAAARSAQSLNAHAYTTGNNIVFNGGQYAPDSESGKRLLGHELTHVLQQDASKTNSIQRYRHQRQASRSDSALAAFRRSAARLNSFTEGSDQAQTDQLIIALHSAYNSFINLHRAYSAQQILTIRRILLSRMESAPRAADGALMMTNTFTLEVTPWTEGRPQRVEDIQFEDGRRFLAPENIAELQEVVDAATIAEAQELHAGERMRGQRRRSHTGSQSLRPSSATANDQHLPTEENSGLVRHERPATPEIVSSELEQNEESVYEQAAGGINQHSIFESSTIPEIEAGLRILRERTVGQISDVVRDRLNQSNQSDPQFRNALAATRNPQTNLLQTTNLVLYVTNRAYLIDRTGHLAQGNFQYDLSMLGMRRGAVYFFSRFRLWPSMSYQVAMVRVSPGPAALTGGDLDVRRAALSLLEAISVALAGTRGGVAIIVSNQETGPILGNVAERTMRVWGGAFRELPWAGREVMATWTRRPGAAIEGQLLSTLVSCALNLAGRAGALYQIVQQSFELGEYFGLAYRARSLDELNLLAQGIARILAGFILGLIQSGLTLAGRVAYNAYRQRSQRGGAERGIVPLTEQRDNPNASDNLNDMRALLRDLYHHENLARTGLTEEQFVQFGVEHLTNERRRWNTPADVQQQPSGSRDDPRIQVRPIDETPNSATPGTGSRNPDPVNGTRPAESRPETIRVNSEPRQLESGIPQQPPGSRTPSVTGHSGEPSVDSGLSSPRARGNRSDSPSPINAPTGIRLPSPGEFILNSLRPRIPIGNGGEATHQPSPRLAPPVAARPHHLIPAEATIDTPRGRAIRFLRDRANMQALLRDNPDTALQLLQAHGNWRDLVVFILRDPAYEYLIHPLQQLRDSVVADLRARFGLRLSDANASTHPVSDVDLATTGVDAGRRMLDAEQYMRGRYGPNWTELFRMNFYTEAERLFAYDQVWQWMTDRAFGEMQGRVTELSETLNLARMLRHSGGDPASNSRIGQLMEHLTPAQWAEARVLAAETPNVAAATVQTQHMVIDNLAQLFATIPEDSGTGSLATVINGLHQSLPPHLRAPIERSTTHIEARIAVAQALTEMQMQANFRTVEANISPGANRQVVRGVVVRGHEAYQSALSQLEMMEHIVHESGGNIEVAAREYELYKYIERFMVAAQLADIPLNAFMRGFSQVAYDVYKRNRNSLQGVAGRDMTHLMSMHQEFITQATGILTQMRDRARQNPHAWSYSHYELAANGTSIRDISVNPTLQSVLNVWARRHPHRRRREPAR